MYELRLPDDGDEEQPDNVVVGPFPTPPAADAATDDGVVPAEKDQPDTSSAVVLREMVQAELLPRAGELLDRLVVGDGLFGQRPASIATLARQYWIDPPQCVREAAALRIAYGLYGVPVIAANVATQTILLIIRYPSLLAAVVVVGAAVYLFTVVLA